MSDFSKPFDLSLTHVVEAPTVVSSAPPPMLLLSHGFGSNEMDLISLAQYLDPRLLIISVRAPHVLGRGSYAWYSLYPTPNGLGHDAVQGEQSRQALHAFLQEAVQAYGADPKRVYLGGFSQGAIMSLALALTYPEDIAGVVAMSGAWPKLTVPVAAEERLKDLSFFVSHGTQDTVLAIQFGREIHQSLQKLPVDVTYREYSMGHTISEQSLSDAKDWLTARLDLA